MIFGCSVSMQMEFIMNKLLTNLVLGFAAFGVIAVSPAASDDAKAAYYAAADKAAADYRDAHALCETLERNAQLICIEEAKLAQTRVKMNAEAQYRNTDQARQRASSAIANAEFAVAMARCEQGRHRQEHLHQASPGIKSCSEGRPEDSCGRVWNSLSGIGTKRGIAIMKSKNAN